MKIHETLAALEEIAKEGYLTDEEKARLEKIKKMPIVRRIADMRMELNTAGN